MKLRVALATAATACLAVTGGVVVITSAASAASTGCTANYTIINQWQGGFQAGVSFTDLGDPLSTWTLAFDFPDANQKVTQGWSADWTQSGTAVTAKNAAWNGTLGAGQSVDIGFNGSHTGTNNNPTAFTLNGATCTIG